MKEYSVAVIDGDGIGPEVTAPAKQVLKRAGEKFGFHVMFQDYDWGSEYYLQHGKMMPPNATRAA